MITIDQILSRESSSRRDGSGIKSSDLNGVWLLMKNWTKDGALPPPGTSPLLRLIGAQLQLQTKDNILKICNQVNLGVLKLRFEGQAELKGSRPLLLFHFSTLLLSIGAITLVTKELPEPSARRTPFFALIELKHQDGTDWLAARGRGGGVALWKRLESTGQ